jgi:hypothetical protein
MTSQLNVDTIVDKAGSGGTNVKIGNTSTYVSDSGGATQNTVQGLCKCWNNFKGDGTAAINDSFNMASLTDNGSGDYTTTFTNAFNNATYSFSGVPLYLGSRVYVYGNHNALTAYATGSFRMETVYISATDGTATNDDPRDCNMNFHGDLA